MVMKGPVIRFLMVLVGLVLSAISIYSGFLFVRLLIQPDQLVYVAVVIGVFALIWVPILLINYLLDNEDIYTFFTRCIIYSSSSEAAIEEYAA